MAAFGASLCAEISPRMCFMPDSTDGSAAPHGGVSRGMNGWCSAMGTPGRSLASFTSRVDSDPSRRRTGTRYVPKPPAC
jgi:hypothetical protein